MDPGNSSGEFDAFLNQIYTDQDDTTHTEIPQIDAVFDAEADERAVEFDRATEKSVFNHDRTDSDDAHFIVADRLRQFAAKDRRDVLTEHVGTLFVQLTAPNTDIRRHVAQTVIVLFDDADETNSLITDSFIEYTSELTALLGDELLSVRRAAVYAIETIAMNSPGAIVPTIDALIPLLSAEESDIRQTVVNTITAIIEISPSDAVPTIRALTTLLGDDVRTIRLRAERALTLLTETAPDAAVPAVDALIPLLETENTYARKTALKSSHGSHCSPRVRRCLPSTNLALFLRLIINIVERYQRAHSLRSSSIPLKT
ncbi:HEAT repeat domain-containing protein [Halocatena marina]|uniref:HEAT repeat domain-containing protein n=1 Tax=Halocatena marina TaxID=2934937 RepID=A0ABD5YHG7_9EURY